MATALRQGWKVSEGRPSRLWRMDRVLGSGRLMVLVTFSCCYEIARHNLREGGGFRVQSIVMGKPRRLVTLYLSSGSRSSGCVY